ncbi:hypothetical protein FDECE_15274 [Fusarium decemcellulare]|nr:hypothetical protein FDECE_15274 [Fusarium decemcellulare]
MHFITAITTLAALVVGVSARDDELRVRLYESHDCESLERGRLELTKKDAGVCKKIANTTIAVRIKKNEIGCDLFVFKDSECTVGGDSVDGDRCYDGDDGLASLEVAITMDPFIRLPPEIRLQIILELRSRGDISHLTCASRIMLDQLRCSRSHINRFLMRLEFDEDNDLIQDAVAILKFPPINLAGIESYSSMVKLHVFSWAKHQLPNPFENKDAQLLRDFAKLYNRLRMFIQDYLTKATGIFPPRAYLCLRDMSLNKHEWTFRSQPVKDLRGIYVSDLKDSERKRFLRAFLRYELTCRLNLVEGVRRLSGHLERLNKYMSQEFSYWENEAVHCVGVYVETLYAAMFAQCGDSWLPAIPQNSTPDQPRDYLPPRGLLFPDNIRVNPEFYAEDLTGLYGRTTLASKLSDYGLDLAANLIALTISGSNGRQHLRKWFQDFLHTSRKYVEDPQAPGLGSKLRAQLSLKYPLLPHIYRQRAWAFLDDERFFPRDSAPRHLPEEDELQPGSEAMDPDWFFDPAAARAQRRSQKWHDENDEAGVTLHVKTQLSDEPEMTITTVQTVPRFFNNMRGYCLPMSPEWK